MGTTTYVDFTTDFGDIVIQLYDDDAPQTVQDFLGYAENMTIGAGYEDSFFSRLVSGFVLQGGGYDYNNGSISAIMTGSTVDNEYSASHPNTEGTVSLAKVANDPNSGTDQFFINLADNSSNLDNQDGGFTVFGTITAASWPVVEAIAALPVVDAGSPFDSLPVQGTITDGTVTGDNLVVITDVTVSDTAPCYARGTRIQTVEGAIPVECLRIGDRVITARGGSAAIRWLGHRRVDCRTHANPDQVLPVRIAAHAFAPGTPVRDLFLSPDHAVFLDGILIPIKHLINGRSIAQIAVEGTEYWHVELDGHDILLAENLPAESYLDTGNRSAFANGGVNAQLFADFAPLAWDRACAELVEEGPRLEAAKVALFRRAGIAEGRPTLSLGVTAGEDCLELHSPVWVPAHCLAASLDRRRLGVRVFGIALDSCPLDLDDPELFSGFHPAENTAEGRCRWTDGHARLVLPRDVATVTLRLERGQEVRKEACSFLKKRTKKLLQPSA